MAVFPLAVQIIAGAVSSDLHIPNELLSSECRIETLQDRLLKSATAVAPYNIVCGSGWTTEKVRVLRVAKGG